MVDRHRRKGVSLSARIGLTVATVIAVLVTLGLLIETVMTIAHERDRLNREVDKVVAGSYEATVQAAWNLDDALMRSILNGFISHPLIAEVDLDVRGMERAVKAPENSRASGLTTGLTSGVIDLFGPQRRDFRLIRNGEPLGRLILSVDAGEMAYQIESRLKRSALGSLALTATITLVLFLLLRRNVGRPVERLIDRIEHYDPDAEPPPVPAAGHGDDEITRLERAFVRLLNNVWRYRQDLEMVTRRLTAAITGADLVAFEADIDDDGIPAVCWTTGNIGTFLGYPHGCRVPRSAWRDALHPEDARRVMEDDRRYIADGGLADQPQHPHQTMYRMITYDNRVVVVETTAFVERDVNGKPVRLVGISRNVTARYEAERRVAELASKDSLTGLGNRATLEKALEEAVAEGKARLHQTAAIHLDLDKFKIINDTYGHGVADRVLRVVGTRWAQLLPTGATIHRLGGDEFVVVANQTTNTPGAALRMAEKLITAAGDALPDDLPPVTLSASAGVAMIPLDGETAEEILMALGYAMQAAKQGGGNAVRIYQTRHGESVRTRIALEKDLADAVQREELTLYYQPRISPDGRMVSVEALARWITPTRTVSPGVFIPMAEETGLILQLGHWALRVGCRQAKDWHRRFGANAPRVAINVSARQLMASHFEADVATALREADIAPERIELELTESAALGQIEDARQKVGRLRDLGVGVAVDDFGTGYSALSYIAKLPFTAIKIDQSFTQELPHQPAARAVVTAALQIAADLDMSVVAEGVETAAQADYLIKANVHELQGYHYARPMPADQLEAQWLTGKVVALRPTPVAG